jgi:hypothetical protein
MDEACQNRLEDLTPEVPPDRNPQVRPKAVIIGGQPGAGKSSTQTAVREELGSSSVALYDGDENAEAHPAYKDIARDRPFDGHQIAESHLPGDLHQRAMDQLRAGETKFDVIASHPLGRKEWAEAWTKGFSDEGYHVSVAFVATHESNSLLGIADRYQVSRDEGGGGRWLEPETHDRFYSEIPDVAHHLESEGHVDSMYVTNRNGDLLYENHRGPDGFMRDPLGARDTIVQERERQPTAAETDQHRSRMAYLRDPERLGPGQDVEPVDQRVLATAAEAERRHDQHREASTGQKGPPVLETSLSEAVRAAGERDTREREQAAQREEHGPGRQSPDREPKDHAERSRSDDVGASPPTGKGLDDKLERIRHERREREDTTPPNSPENEHRRRTEPGDDLDRDRPVSERGPER